MKFTFKKVAALIASAAMFGSTAGIAAAVSYPAPFVSGSSSDVALVVGQEGVAASTDLVAATDIGANLASKLATGSIGGAVTTSGEVTPLFTSSSKIYMNDSININRATLTANELPTVLAEGEFSGNVDSTYQQRLLLGSNPIVQFAKEPTGDEDPTINLGLGTTATTQYVYNATVTFDQAVNFTHADSKGQTLNLFGQKFTISSASTSSKIVLLKSSEKLSLVVGGSNPNPVETVTVAGSTYTVELKTATDSAATVKVTDSTGASDSKEVSEAQSKKIQGLEVAVDLADESTSTSTSSAEVIVGASKVTFQDGNAVKMCSDDSTVDGTQVDFVDTTITGNITQLVIQIAADNDDENAIVPGKSFTDPVFGSFKVDFPGLNIADTDSTREVIDVKNSGADKMTVNFKDYNGNTPSSAITWVYNKTDSGGGMILADSSNQKIHVAEIEAANRSDYIMVGNDDDGGLFEVTTITNATTGYSDDSVEFKDVFTGGTIKATITSEGVGSVVLKGKTYDVNYFSATAGLASAARTVRLGYPDSTGSDIIMYPTIQTQKGALIGFYEPKTIDLLNYTSGAVTTPQNLSGSNIKIPNGNGYDSTAIVLNQNNATIDGTNLNMTVAAGLSSVAATVGQLVYNFTNTGTDADNKTKIYLVSPGGNTNIIRPALIIFEEKDDNSAYEAIVVTLDAGYDGSSAGVGVSDIDRTWGADASWDDVQLESNTDLYKDVDLWGTIATVDKSDTDQSFASISYPDDQVYAQIYVSSLASSVSTDGTGNIVPVKDSQIDSVSGKNLIVVGGSCINTIAAKLLTGNTAVVCGADFTTLTNVGTDKYLIETFTSPYAASKVATLVAGYNAQDTSNAAKALTTATIEIAAGKKYVGTTASDAALA